MANTFRPFLALVVAVLLLFRAAVPAAALHTNSRWIVDDAGRRVKLACANWASHLEAMVAEGLSKQPVDAIAKRFGSNGFNCVRFTWATHMVTDDRLGNQTVRQSFQSAGLSEYIPGLQNNNPSLLDISLVDAFQRVVSTLSTNGVMIILDNHVSKPQWCCDDSDGNGFFGDTYFDPKEWVSGLSRVAAMFGGNRNVIGMSLRNELRGPNQNENDWYIHMQEGAEAVHAANPDVLVILSGLSYDTNLRFLRSRPVQVSFTRKIVYEVHWYRFDDTELWQNGNPNEVCNTVSSNVMARAGFLLESGLPLFVSEFGWDQSGNNAVDNNYMSCFMAMAAKLDFDWAVWTMVGSYYQRSGRLGYDESFGLLSSDWGSLRNPNTLQRLNLIQQALQGPGAKLQKLLFHPSSGKCVRRTMRGLLMLGACTGGGTGTWMHTAQKRLTTQGQEAHVLCFKAPGMGHAARLGSECSDQNSKWAAGSSSPVLSSNLENGTAVCLGVASDGTVVTEACKCASRDNGSCDAASQWFAIIDKSTGTSALSKTNYTP